MGIKKILFVQKQPFPYFGILSLSAMLESKGYDTDVLIASLENKLQDSVRRIKPDLIGITAMSMERSWVEKAASALKAICPDIPIILGGVHAILYPEDAVKINNVDYICTSDGEMPLINLISCLETDWRDKRCPKGIWACGRRQGVIRSEREMLTEDISRYKEDRGVYYKRYPVLRDDPVKFFLGSRGCPYQCAFCFNKQMQETFKDKGKYLRRKEPRHFIDEIKNEKARGVLKYINFSDDLFAADAKWLAEFSDLYKAHIKIPFMCQIRPEFAADDVLARLKDSGCDKVVFGVETGNEELRAGILSKRIKNEDIIRMAESARKHGMRVHTFNVFGIPSETLENSFETITLNLRIKADMAASSMLMIFPGTALADFAIKSGWLSPDYSFDDIPRSFHRGSALRMPAIEKQELLHKVTAILCRYPGFLPFIKMIIGIDNAFMTRAFGVMFFPFFLLSHAFRYKGSGNSLLQMIRFTYRFRKSY